MNIEIYHDHKIFYFHHHHNQHAVFAFLVCSPSFLSGKHVNGQENYGLCLHSTALPEKFDNLLSLKWWQKCGIVKMCAQFNRFSNIYLLKTNEIDTILEI